MTETGNGSGSVRCERCGRDNPAGLRFCQDCGNRLESAAVAPVAPRSSEDRTAPQRARPPAPSFEFSARAATPEEPPACPACHVSNPDNGRFCVNCGYALSAAAAPPEDPSPAPAMPPPPSLRVGQPPVGPSPLDASPRFAPPPSGRPIPRVPRPAGEPFGGSALPSAPQSARSSALVGAPVVAVSEHGQPPAEPVQCSRCRGTNARHMTFCQFCGARLGLAADGFAMTAASTALSASAPIAPASAQLPSFGAPSASELEPARLVVIAQDGTPGRHYPLNDEQVDIGREEGAILLPSDPYVSPRHARITRRGGRIFVRDLSSVNGVYVRIRAAERLQHADLVLIGLEVLRFEVVSDAEKGLGPATERGARVFGSPALPRYARLCQRTVEGATRDVFYLSRDETVVGRESGDVVFTNDPFMSRRHASLTRDPASGAFSLQDLGSSNGTYLAIRGEHEIASGDHVRVGQHLFRLDVEAGRARS